MLKELKKITDETTERELHKKKLRKHITQKERQKQKEKDIHDRLVTNGILFGACVVWFIYIVVKMILTWR